MKHFQLSLVISLFVLVFTFSFIAVKPVTTCAQEITDSTEELPATTEEGSEEGNTTEDGTVEEDTPDEETTEDEDSTPEEGTTSEEGTNPADTTAPNAPADISSDTPANDVPANDDTKPAKNNTTNLDRWMNVCEAVGDNLIKRNFIYSNSGTRSTYGSALSTAKRSNCALYVSWCLQQYGALKPGQTFYVRGSGTIHKNFRKFGGKVKVIRVYKQSSSVDLQKGDVVCWAGLAHTNIYAGRNSSGDRLWFDAGKSATYGSHSGSRYENVGAKQQSYLNSRKISYIIRIKNV